MTSLGAASPSAVIGLQARSAGVVAQQWLEDLEDDPHDRAEQLPPLHPVVEPVPSPRPIPRDQEPGARSIASWMIVGIPFPAAPRAAPLSDPAHGHATYPWSGR
jgi:hypothetical protein